MYTTHAIGRMQQRGIAQECVEAVIAFGKEQSRRGGFVYLATRRTVEKMLKMGVPKRVALRSLGVYVVVAGGLVATTGHKTTKFKN